MAKLAWSRHWEIFAIFGRLAEIFAEKSIAFVNLRKSWGDLENSAKVFGSSSEIFWISFGVMLPSVMKKLNQNSVILCSILEKVLVWSTRSLWLLEFFCFLFIRKEREAIPENSVNHRNQGASFSHITTARSGIKRGPKGTRRGRQRVRKIVCH